MGNVYGPGEPRLDGDRVVYDAGALPPAVSKTAPDAQVQAGGKPSRGTPKDGRLKPNRPASKKGK